MPSSQNKKDVKDKIYGIDIDFITFTSSSTVDNFFKYLSPTKIKSQKNTKFVSIGPITAKRLKAYGIKADLICKKFTIDNLLSEIVKYNKR